MSSRWSPRAATRHGGGDHPSSRASHLFQAANRNKRSVVLDLKTAEGRARARGLATGADVVIQALRFGVADRLGIGYDRIRDENPGLIYVSVTSHGLAGPLRDDPGYDP